MRIRKYLDTDREHCLAVFDSNVPDEIRADQRPDYERFLDEHPDPYWVIEERWQVIGCGGVSVEPEGATASLCWGMVLRSRQREGWGRYLLQARLAWARRQPAVRVVTVRATPRTQPFFERFGFRPVGGRVDGSGRSGDAADAIGLRLDLASPAPPKRPPPSA